MIAAFTVAGLIVSGVLVARLRCHHRRPRDLSAVTVPNELLWEKIPGSSEEGPAS